jgi:hypothetical protein
VREREKINREDMCGGEGEEREKSNFCKKCKSKKYYFNDIGNG